MSKSQRKKLKHGVEGSRGGAAMEVAELGGAGRPGHEEGDTHRRRVRVSGAGQRLRDAEVDSSEEHAAELRETWTEAMTR